MSNIQPVKKKRKRDNDTIAQSNKKKKKKTQRIDTDNLNVEENKHIDIPRFELQNVVATFNVLCASNV